jgi:glycosyltransferase involved in cell wall biosynthesis
MSPTTTSLAPDVSIIIPARNEESNLRTCLESLISQTNVPFEIIVVNDHSTDKTGEIASSFGGVRVLEAGPLPTGWTGKNNAVATGARAANADWILFTDADTVHLPGSLDRALNEAKECSADLLSYSPEQIAITFWEMATLPVVFAELARQYPPSKVSDPDSPEAAANGQFILVKREVYEAIGGHAAVAFDILEDVALARAVKRSGRKIRFRYAPDAVRTRMYRDFHQLREGWTKNLAILFPGPAYLLFKMLLLWTLPFIVVIAVAAMKLHLLWLSVAAIAIGFDFMLIRRANFRTRMTMLAVVFGMPMFVYLLLRSRRAHKNGRVSWKGRIYDHAHASSVAQDQTSMTAEKIA